MTPLLRVDGVTVGFSGRRVLDDVHLRLEHGEFTGLIGSNGAGKTTLLRVILGLLRPDAGRVLIAGEPSEGGEPSRGGELSGGREPIGSRQRVGSRRRDPLIGYVPQKVALDPDLPLRAWDLVALGVDGQRPGIPWPGRGARAAERRARVAEALNAVGAESFAGSRVGRLSGGEQQRVMIAHALAGRPQLLLLDEPLANLDISSANEIVAVLGKVCSQQGVAVLISAHDMNPLMPYMDRLVYMADGRVASGATDEVVQSEVLSRLYGHPVEVLRVQGRVLVVGGDAETHCP